MNDGIFCLFNRAFSFNWWAWLVFTGTMIASAISVKFVGLFVVILVGTHTAADLWDVLGDLSKPIVSSIYLMLISVSVQHYKKHREDR
jgi:dolichyl-phosphate-mannose--protein O-mannosyl transferase